MVPGDSAAIALCVQWIVHWPRAPHVCYVAYEIFGCSTACVIHVARSLAAWNISALLKSILSLMRSETPDAIRGESTVIDREIIHRQA